jgi:nucleoside-diphosphate-sugar epimerase/phosphoglycolate phosphatase-like HAD superfamily hydrolase
MKRVLVTGAHGFVGGSFCRVAGRKFKILPVSRITKAPYPSADYVLHLGARTAKVKNDPMSLAIYRRDNVSGTKKFLRNLHKKLSYFLYVSTTDVERVLLTPYAQSKLEAEQVVSEYCNKQGIPYGIARLGSVFGPGEGEYGKVIPTFTALALAGKPPKITDPTAVRKFIYVDDVAKQLIKCIQTKQTGIVHVIGKNEISIAEVARRIRYLVKNASKGDLTQFDKNLLREIAWFRKRRTIFFDVDGTIINHWARMYAVYKRCCQYYGYTAIPFATYQKNKRNGIPDITLKHTLWKQRRIEEPAMLAKDTLVPGMKNVLKKLHSSHNLIIVSARQSKRKLMKQLENFGIKGYVSKVMTVGVNNPANKKARVARQGVLVGDTEIEVAATSRTGIDCISVIWGTRSEDFLRRHGATRVVRTPKSLGLAIESPYKGDASISGKYPESRISG